MFFGLIVYIYNLNFCTQLQIPLSPFMWLCVICLSIFPTIISLETITIAIKLIGSTTTAILGALEPLTAIFFGILFFDEHLTLRITLGIISFWSMHRFVLTVLLSSGLNHNGDLSGLWVPELMCIILNL